LRTRTIGPFDYVIVGGGTAGCVLADRTTTSQCPMTSESPSSRKVRGGARLRLIDASIMPTITSGNTNSPTVMIAGRGAMLVAHDNARS